jgi:hypothetical protein
MSLKIEAEKVLVWDNDLHRIVPRTAVRVLFVGNKGTVFAEQGPLYCETAKDMFDAVQQLKKRLIGQLPFQGEHIADRII